MSDAARLTGHQRSLDAVRPLHGDASKVRTIATVPSGTAWKVGDRCITQRTNRAIPIDTECLVVNVRGLNPGFVLLRAMVKGRQVSGWFHIDHLDRVEEGAP
jgi:hypothetical protein